jgi:hypothetical protein
MATQDRLSTCLWLWFVLPVVGMLFLTSAALGQGFMVKPMRMEAEVGVAQALEIPLEIRNTGLEGAVNLDVRLVELSQTPDGSWRMIEPAAAGTESPRSSLPWTTLSVDRVEIAPLEPATVTVQVRPPSAAQGGYFAAILVETPAAGNVAGVAFRTRFLIPLTVQIRGRPGRQKVALDNVAMTYEAGAPTGPTTTANLSVTNRGNTLSRIRGQLQIYKESDGKWRPVARLEFTERVILPGLTLTLAKDLERRLPSGKYRLRGELFIDGRRVAPIVKDVAFVGDPDTISVAYDTVLILTPALVDIDVAPGATRTTVVQIENPGTEPVMVHIRAATPRGLAGMDMARPNGTALSAEPWTEVRPAEFTIRPGGRRNVRVISRVPLQGLDQPHYYADLILAGQYEDGQSAGDTRSTIHLANQQVASTADGIIEQVSIAQGDDPRKYVLQMRFANLGNTHLEPSVRSVLLTPQGLFVVEAALTGEEGPLLPFGKRSYSGELDFTEVKPGYYSLRFMATIATDIEITKQEVIFVETDETVGLDGTKRSVPRVAIVDTAPGEVPPESLLDPAMVAPSELPDAAR